MFGHCGAFKIRVGFSGTFKGGSLGSSEDPSPP